MGTTSAERMREKRARDRGMVWGEEELTGALSDTALMEQLAYAYRKARAGQGTAIATALLKEAEKRLLPQASR